MKENTQRGTETILYVEDDPMVRKLNLTILERLGYRVLLAEDGPAALALADEFDGTLDMLITDVVMPEMNGEELSRRIRGMCPQIKILFTSGYTEDIIAPRGVLENGTHFLSKPYRPTQLAEKVRGILDDE